MRIIAVDDEEGALSELVYEIRSAVPDAEVVQFSVPEKALEYMSRNQCDVAFIDIEMPDISGVVLAKQMKKHDPYLNVIFETGYSQYGTAAMQLHASGYILKPVTKTSVINEIDSLRYPVKDHAAGIRAVTFGEFELLVNGEQVRFRRAKSKEMLAYLVDQHGRAASKKEIAVILFEDRMYSRNIQDYMKKITSDLKESLRDAGAEKVLKYSYNSYAVDMGAFSCDLYEYEKGSAEAVNAFHGRYMSQYSWA